MSGFDIGKPIGELNISPVLVSKIDAKADTAYVDSQIGVIAQNGKNIMSITGIDNTGVTDNYTALNNYLTSIGSTPTDLYFPRGTYKLSSSIIIPINVRIVMANGAMLSPDTTKTVYLNGTILSGIYQIFTGLGIIAGTPLVEKVYPEWFGAKGDGTTDDSLAFTSTFTFCNINKSACILTKAVYNLASLTKTLDSIKVIGSSNNTLKNVGQFTMLGDVYLENVTINEITSRIFLNMTPSTFSNIYINKVIVTNTAGFTTRLRAGEFIYANNGGTATGIDNLYIGNSTFTYLANSCIYLFCHIKRGVIENNKMTEIGYTDNTDVNVIMLGYQDGSNNITGPAQKVLISHNHIENIYTKRAPTYANSGEGHAILCYGFDVIIRNNFVKNLYGSGTIDSALECGYNREAIYTKTFYTIIEGNHVINGCGDGGNGGITAKASSYAKILNNTVEGIYGSGIYVITEDATISKNTIILSIPASTPIATTGTSALSLTGWTGATPCLALVEGNLIKNYRGLTTPSNTSVSVGECKNVKFSNNHLISSATYTFYSASTENLTMHISDNIFDVTNGRPIQCYGTTGERFTSITNNKFIYQNTDGVYWPIMTIPDMNGNYVITNNKIKLYTKAQGIANLSVAQYCVENNVIHVTTGIPIITAAFEIDTNTIRTAVSSVCGNVIEGDKQIDNFIRFSKGDYTNSLFNIGTVKVANNKVQLRAGSFISGCVNGEPIVTQSLMIHDNYIETSSNDKIWGGNSRPLKNYFEDRNLYTLSNVVKSKFEIFDDFNQQVLTENESQWILNSGIAATPASTPATDPVIALDERGKVRLTTGNKSGLTAEDASQIICAIPVQADSTGLTFEARLKINSAITGVSVNVGLTDTTSLEEPFTIATGDVVTSVASDASCFVYDADATTKTWLACNVDSDVDDDVMAKCGSVVVINCENVWDEQVITNVTANVDSGDFKLGSKSCTFAVADGFTTGIIGNELTNNIMNLTGFTHLSFWFKSDVALSSGDYQLLLSATPLCATPLETINIPAILANTWTFCQIPIAVPANLTSIISVGLKQAVDKGVINLKIDHIRAYSATAYAPVADTYQTLKMEVSTDGNTINYYIDGNLVRTSTYAGVTPNVNLYATVIANSTGTLSKTVDVDYIYVSHNR